jgi:hypothetical protein
MTLRRVAAFVFVAGIAFLLGWVLFVGLPEWYVPAQTTIAAPASAPAAPGRKIKARLFYVAESGRKLTSIEQDVAFGDSTVEQAKEIIAAQIAPVVEPLISAVPAGTKLRALFVTPQGQAFVDFSTELSKGQPGGSLNELLTIYTIVDVLTANLPAVTAVQLLVDGKEINTLAGHVDLRRPFLKNLALVE